MKLSAYFDESGTHGGKVALMAGYAANKRQWKKFDKRVGKLFHRFGVRIFHGINWLRGENDFKNWPIDRKIEFLDEFQHIASDTLTFGVVTVLSYEDYKWYCDLPWPKQVRKDAMYTLLFRGCVAATMDAAEKQTGDSGYELNLVLESGARNANDALRIFNEIRAKTGNAPALSSLRFEKKDQRGYPLMLADMLAYSAYRKETGAKHIGTARKATKSDKSYRGNLVRVPLGRETLKDLYDLTIEISTKDGLDAWTKKNLGPSVK